MTEILDQENPTIELGPNTHWSFRFFTYAIIASAAIFYSYYAYENINFQSIRHIRNLYLLYILFLTTFLLSLFFFILSFLKKEGTHPRRQTVRYGIPLLGLFHLLAIYVL